MSRTYKKSGDVLDYPNATGDTIAAGATFAWGNLICVALADIPDGETGSVSVTGVHELPKIAGADCAAGTNLLLDVSADPVAFDDAAAVAAEGDIVGGAMCLEDAGTGTTVVTVRLAPGSGVVEPAA